MSRRLLFLAVLAWLATTARSLRSEEGRYLAVLSDATRVEGEVVSGWHEHPGETRLDSTTLDTSDRRLAWFRDRNVPQYNAADQAYGFIESVSGDRFPGRVVAYAAPVNDTPEHFVVESELSLRLPEAAGGGRFRVSMRGIRRIVFALGEIRQVTPNTLYFFDGRRVSYRSLRWQADGLVILTARGTQRVAFDELDEIHFPASDPWESYYRELAKLSPDGRSRLIRLATTDGLLATGSEADFDATGRVTARCPLDEIETTRCGPLVAAGDRLFLSVARGVEPATTRELFELVPTGNLLPAVE